MRETFGEEYVHYQERVGRYVTLPLALRCRVRDGWREPGSARRARGIECPERLTEVRVSL